MKNHTARKSPILINETDNWGYKLIGTGAEKLSI